MQYKTLVEKIISSVQPKNKRAVFIFGRMNPPTIGHELLIANALKIASEQNRDCYVFLSKTQDKKKNPVPYEHKLNAINSALPNVNFVNSQNVVTIFDVVEFLVKSGYDDLVLIAGSDRAAEYKQLFNKYINHPDPEKRLNLSHFDVEVAGSDRDPDSDNASGASATKARSLATTGDYESFKRILPANMPDDQVRTLFNDIRNALK